MASSVCRLAISCFLSGLLVPIAAAADDAQTYEAPLPVRLFTDPDLCAHAPCRDVIPGAESFSARKGRPSYVEAYGTEANQQKLIGYVFLSTDIVDIRGYSGKPVVTLIGMDTKGRVTGAKVLRHSESVLKLGIPEAALTRFVGQYVGRFAGEEMQLGKPHGRSDSDTGLDAISGATVTSVSQNQAMLQSALEIAREVGIVKQETRPQAAFADVKDQLGWDEMVAEGSIQRLTVSPGDGDAVIDMYFGLLNAPALGKSILGEQGYNGLMSRLHPGEHAIFIAARGAESFKGSGFAHGGIFERLQVAQGIDTFIFRALDYLKLDRIEAANAPAFRESGMFIIRSDRFSGAYPWRLQFLVSTIDPAIGGRRLARFEREYWLPARYLQGGHPAIGRPVSIWQAVWKQKKGSIVLLGLLLAALILVNGLSVRRMRRTRRIRL